MRIYAYYNNYFDPVSILSGIAKQNKEKAAADYFICIPKQRLLDFFGMRKHSAFLK